MSKDTIRIEDLGNFKDATEGIWVTDQGLRFGDCGTGHGSGGDIAIQWNGVDLATIADPNPTTYCWLSEAHAVLLTVPVEPDSAGIHIAEFFGLDGKPAIRVRFGEGIEPEVLGVDEVEG